MLIAVAIMGVIFMGLTSLLGVLHKENRSISDKIEASDLERQLGLLMADDALCACQFAGAGDLVKEGQSLTPGAESYAVELNKISTSCADPNKTFAVTNQRMSSLSNSFQVNRIAVRDLRPTGRINPITKVPDEYTGVFSIEFDKSEATPRSMRPIKVSKIFTTTSNGKKLYSCASANDFYGSSMVTNGPNATSYNSSITACPEGYRIVSGGWHTDGTPPTCPNATNPRTPMVLESRPITTANGRSGWLVTATCQTFEAIAVCQRGHL